MHVVNVTTDAYKEKIGMDGVNVCMSRREFYDISVSKYYRHTFKKINDLHCI